MMGRESSPTTFNYVWDSIVLRTGGMQIYESIGFIVVAQQEQIFLSRVLIGGNPALLGKEVGHEFEKR